MTTREPTEFKRSDFKEAIKIARRKRAIGLTCPDCETPDALMTIHFQGMKIGQACCNCPHIRTVAQLNAKNQPSE
jgi:Zn ribbon nucleic-acid-binding protein